jgi:hypothetical protein
MRAAVLAVVASVGCGRIAFDVQNDGGAGGGDARSDGNGDGGGSQPVYVANSLAGVTSAIYSLEPATGALTFIGDVPLGHGEMTALAVKDANSLWAMTFTGVFLEITLSPYAVGVHQTGLGAPVGLETNPLGGLMVLDETANTIYRITPIPYAADSPRVMMDPGGPIDADGGDLYPAGGVDYYVWTNSNFGLYQLNYTTGMGNLIGISTRQVYIVGLAMIDGQMYGIGRDSDAIHPIDLATGEIGVGIPLCLDIACPAPFDLNFGDIAAP